MFDAEKLTAAFEKPIYISIKGKRTIGRPLSHPQHVKVLFDLEAAGNDVEATEKILRQALVDMGFEECVDEIIALPDPLYWEAIKDFFRCCRGEPPKPTPPAAPTEPGAKPTP